MGHTCGILRSDIPKRLDLGVGIGLRSMHYQTVLEERPSVPFYEVVSENYMGIRQGSGGRPLEMLEKVRRDTPVFLHGVSMNIGSSDPLRPDYLERLKTLIQRIEPEYVSDHLCWTGVGGENLHDLLPLPFTEEAVRHVVSRVRRVQDLLGRRFFLENVSSYVTFASSEMTEWEFLCEIAARADCGILLDVNNVYVSAQNNGFDPMTYLRHIPEGRVGYMHLAGYAEQEGLLIDTHGQSVSAPVWDLYAEATRLFGAIPTLIEWDENIPPLKTLLDEAAKAEAVRQTVLKEAFHDRQHDLVGVA